MIKSNEYEPPLSIRDFNKSISNGIKTDISNNNSTNGNNTDVVTLICHDIPLSFGIALHDKTWVLL